MKFGDEKEGSLKNDYQFQGDYSEMDEDIGWNDFFLRNYDAQIGRWIQQDPYDEFPSPYIGMGNNPILFVDPDGGCVTCVQTLQEVVVEGVKRTSTIAAASASSKMFTGMMQASMRSITKVARLSSEQSLVKLHMQPFPPPLKEGSTISQGGGSYVSEGQKVLNAQSTLAAGYNPDGSLTPLAKL